MGKSAKENRPYNLKPVKRIELSDKNTTLRSVLAILLLVVGAVALTMGVYSLITADPGWTVIESNSSEYNCSGEFVFNYCIGYGEESATAEKRHIEELYSDLTQKAYKIFNSDSEFEGISNVCTLNQKPNEPVQIDSVLYLAFEKALSYDNRAIYLSAIFAEYENNFFGHYTTSVSADLDPYVNDEFADYLKMLADFSSSDEHINLELLGDNTVKLNISPEYIAFADEYEVTDFIGFSWFKNAFIADYIALSLTENGYTYGNITSYDGFMRNLDSESEEMYVYNIFNRVDSRLYLASKMNYKGGTAIVTMRDYPISDNDVYRYFTKKDGSIITPYADEADGLYKNSVDTLTLYSSTKGCVDILFSAMPVYISSSFDISAVRTLSDNGIHSLWCEEGVLRFTDKNADLLLQSYEETEYKKAYAFD